MKTHLLTTACALRFAKPQLRARQSGHRRAWQHALCWLLVALLIPTAASTVVAAESFPCLWSRCQKRTFDRFPQLCPEHRRRPNTTDVGERLVAMIWAGDTAGIAKLAPVADPDAWITGLPPLAHAIMADRPESAQALLDAGAWPEFRNPAGENLAAYAARRGKPRMVEFFLSKGIGRPEDVENVPRGGMEDFRRDDRRYEQERLKAEGAAQVIEELFKRDVERDTGYRPKRGLRDMWSDAEKAMSAYSASTPTAPTNQPVTEGIRREERQEASRSKPTPPDEPVAVQATIVGVARGDTLNIRSGPGMNNRTVGVLENGDEVTIIGRAVMNNETDWYPIRIDGGTGWARGKYLQRK